MDHLHIRQVLFEGGQPNWNGEVQVLGIAVEWRACKPRPMIRPSGATVMQIATDGAEEMSDWCGVDFKKASTTV